MKKSQKDSVLTRCPLLLQSVILLFCCPLNLASTGATTAVPTQLDLSYLHRTKSSRLAEAIRQAIQDGPSSDIEVDLSSSLIGKPVQDIVSALEGANNSGIVKLIARHNHWSPMEATSFLHAILGPEATSDSGKKSKKSKRSRSKTASQEEVRSSERSSDEETKTSPESEATDQNTTISSVEGTNATKPAFVSVGSLDMSWNNFSPEQRSSKAFLQALQKTVASEKCPTTIKLAVCGLGPSSCRAIAKGIISRYETSSKMVSDENVNMPTPLALLLTRNEAIGDSGVAALAAAIRTATSKSRNEASTEDCVVLEALDLSGCGVGDTGAEALAIAMEQHPMCVKHLDLSNNQISDEGAAGLARALCSGGKVQTLDLSNNKDLEDAGAIALAEALKQGCIQRLILRSCHIHADGAGAMSKAIKHIGEGSSPLERPVSLLLDLSGNPLGILRKKAKSGGGKYSATAIRSKASATTSAYMNLIGKTVQKGLKDLGIADSVPGASTLESDDEEEEKMNGEGSDDQDPSKVKCGALAIADAFLDEEEEEENEKKESGSDSADRIGDCKVSLGLRHCAFDTRASEALAAVKQEALSSLNLDLTVDVRMNNVLEEDTVSALRGDADLEGGLSEMAERYLEALEALKEARRRSMRAAQAEAARMRREKEIEDEWGAPVDMDDDHGYEETGQREYYSDNEDDWDSDADYDDENDMEDFF